MDKHSTEREVRIERLKELRARGINPYPATTSRTHEITAVLSGFEHLQENGAFVVIVGRIMALREHGGASFFDIEDGKGSVQIYCSEAVIKKQRDEDLNYIDMLALLNIGDFIEVEGSAFTTRQGEKTIRALSARILSKALLAVPSKWYGIKDTETRYRKRYLDLLLNKPLREMFQRKAVFWNSMREFLLSRGFLEIDTPVLENTTGGADARAFITHHNALNIDVYLRISAGELWQKRLMVAGFEKTFEIGRIFRNEGIDLEHLQDYKQMECYLAYADYNQGMEFTRELICYIAKKTFGTLQFTINDMRVDLSLEWDKIDFQEEMKKQIGIDPQNINLKDMRARLDELGIEYEAVAERARLMDLLWKQCRKRISGPVFLTHIPTELSPLAKRSHSKPEVAERFQLILAGSELCNGYSELNDPLDQRARFEKQAELREHGDEEAQMNDLDFVEALEYGMPPVCGLGISERLFSFLEGKSIRECVMFPLLRPDTNSSSIKKDGAKIGKVSPPYEGGVRGGKSDNRELRIMDDLEEIKELGITRDEALKLLREHIKNPNLIKHHLAVEIQMRAMAEHFQEQGIGGINPDAWAIAGLLHDMDWEITENEPKRHSIMTAEILNKTGVHPAIVEAIRVHNHIHGIEPKTLMEKALYCAEELTGLVVASTLVQPEKKLTSVDSASVMKKFKDKAFARGVNREIILKCKEFLGMELPELISLTLRAMQGIAGVLGL